MSALSLGSRKCLSDANETTKNDVETKTFVVFVVVATNDVAARVVVQTEAFVSSAVPDSSDADVAFKSLSSLFSPYVVAETKLQLLRLSLLIL